MIADFYLYKARCVTHAVYAALESNPRDPDIIRIKRELNEDPGDTIDFLLRNEPPTSFGEATVQTFIHQRLRSLPKSFLRK